ncbi:cytochrome P450 [Xylariales sp. AK1849]|nr:cytochrome P450 [Xylariales sp. AK1849]
MAQAMIAVALCVIILSQLIRRILIPFPLPGIPYNRAAAWLPWGDLASLGIHNLRTSEVFDWLSLQCLHHRSAVVQVFMPPFSLTSPVVLVADLQEIEDIVTKRTREIDRASMMHDFFGLLAPGATIGMQTTARFKQQRRLWNSILSPSFLNEVVAPCFHEKLCQLIELWGTKANLAPGCAFEAVEDMRQTALEATWTMAVGSSLGLLDAQLAQLRSVQNKITQTSRSKATFKVQSLSVFYNSFGTLLVCLDWVTQGVTPRLYAWVFRHSTIFKKARFEVDRRLASVIGDARRRHLIPSLKPRCALDMVLRQESHKESDGLPTSDEALHDELMELLITGHETTASSTGWALKYLADNQEIQTQLRRSLYDAFPGCSRSHLPSASDLASKNLPSLEATIAEVLRISRTGPVSFREAVVDTRILGHYIPAGTPIILVTAGPSYDRPNLVSVAEDVHSSSSRKTNTKIWDPTIPESSFVPDRWLNDSGDFDSDAGPSLPFSAGARGCFGKKIALLELRLMIALFVINFRFPKLPGDVSLYTSYDGLTRKPTCCYIRPETVVPNG